VSPFPIELAIPSVDGARLEIPILDSLHRLHLAVVAGTEYIVGKIGYFFFGAYQGKIENCVSASVAAQHIEASIKWKQYSSG
jgi:hypothetical protein